MFMKLDVPELVRTVAALDLSGPVRPIGAGRAPVTFGIRIDREDGTREALPGRYGSYAAACDAIDRLGRDVRSLATVVRA